NKSWSLKPNSGLRSTLASARSSCGNSSVSASAIRSITAMCSVSTSRSAPANQHHDVTVARRPSVETHRLARVDQVPHGSGDAARQQDARTDLAHSVEGRVPAFNRLALLRLDRVPDFDHTGLRIGQRDVRRDTPLRIRGDAWADVLEHKIDGVEYALARAKGMFELAVLKIQAAIPVPLPEIVAHRCEFARSRVLEGENRLLFVADREDGADAGPRPCAGGELRHQPLHDLPLFGAGILRLVDQQVIDAEIELEMDP